MKKDVIDEKEVIDSLVGEAPEKNAGGANFNSFGSTGNVTQVGCGCFDIRKMLINLCIYTIALMVTGWLFQGFYIANVGAAVRAAILMSFLNVVVKPFLIFFTLPLTILTMGLFYFMINGIILMIASGFMGSDFQISTLFTAIFASFFISFLQSFMKNFYNKNGRGNTHF